MPDDSRSYELVFSHVELERHAESEAQRLTGKDWASALVMLDRGELRGTIAEVELLMLRALLSSPSPTPIDRRR